MGAVEVAVEELPYSSNMAVVGQVDSTHSVQDNKDLAVAEVMVVGENYNLDVVDMDWEAGHGDEVGE